MCQRHRHTAKEAWGPTRQRGLPCTPYSVYDKDIGLTVLQSRCTRRNLERTIQASSVLRVWTDRRNGTVATDAKQASPLATDGDGGHKHQRCIESNRFAQKLDRIQAPALWGLGRPNAKARASRDDSALMLMGTARTVPPRQRRTGDLLSAAPLRCRPAGSSASARRGAPSWGGAREAYLGRVPCRGSCRQRHQAHSADRTATRSAWPPCVTGRTSDHANG